MKTLTSFSVLLLSFTFFALSALAGETRSYKSDLSKEIIEPDVVPLNEFLIDTSYVFESELTRGDREYGKQNAWHNRIYYGHRISLNDGWYLKLGGKYNRFDFGATSAPVPNKLQALAAVISLEYKIHGTTGFLLETSPGFYFSNDISSAAFDAPTHLGLAYPVFGGQRFFLVGGVSFSLLREYKVLPIVGFAWRISEHLDLKAFLPEPRLVYKPSEDLHLWVGGELAGSSYRTDDHDNIPRKLRNEKLDYLEYRAGTGFTYYGFKPFTIEIAGGYVFDRTFNYHRANREYSSEGAPYIKLQAKAEF